MDARFAKKKKKKKRAEKKTPLEKQFRENTENMNVIRKQKLL